MGKSISDKQSNICMTRLIFDWESRINLMSIDVQEIKRTEVLPFECVLLVIDTD